MRTRILRTKLQKEIAMRSIMEHNFAENSKQALPRSRFYMPFDVKTTFFADYLVPIYKQLLMPGDEIRTQAHFYVRMTTPKLPIFDNLIFETFFFIMPLRRLWQNFKYFFGHRDNPDDSIDFTCPQVDTSLPLTYFNEGSSKTAGLFDLFGFPPQQANLKFNAWYNRMYNWVWNEYFRASTIQDSVPVDIDDGPDSPSDYILLKVNKKHDYFTSCLPSPFIGDPVYLELGSSAPIYGTGNPLLFTDGEGQFAATMDDGTGADNIGNSTNAQGISLGTTVVTPGDVFTEHEVIGIPNKTQLESAVQDDDVGIYVDLSDAVASTITDLRQSIALQLLMELRAKTGNRYRSINLAEYGVAIPDRSLEIPEYIGGGRQYVNFHTVIQQSQSDTTPQGHVAAFADVRGSHRFNTYAHEWSAVIGVACVRADLTYQQGIQARDAFQTRDELPSPYLANLSDQPVLTSEIYATGSPVNDDVVFGYIGRFDNWRYNFSYVAGQFRHDHPNTIEEYHLSEWFGEPPDLTVGFLDSNTPMSRVLQTGDSEAHFKAHIHYEEYITRQLPARAVPSNLGFM